MWDPVPHIRMNPLAWLCSNRKWPQRQGKVSEISIYLALWTTQRPLLLIKHTVSHLTQSSRIIIWSHQKSWINHNENLTWLVAKSKTVPSTSPLRKPGIPTIQMTTTKMCKITTTHIKSMHHKRRSSWSKGNSKAKRRRRFQSPRQLSLRIQH